MERSPILGGMPSFFPWSTIHLNLQRCLEVGDSAIFIQILLSRCIMGNEGSAGLLARSRLLGLNERLERCVTCAPMRR